MEKVPKNERIIKEPIFFAEKSYIDESNSCVVVPAGRNELDYDDCFLLGGIIEKKYPKLKFSAKYELKEDSVIFYYVK